MRTINEGIFSIVKNSIPNITEKESINEFAKA